MRARLIRLAAAGCLIAASLAAVACGNDEDLELAAMVPPDVPVYAEAMVRPEADQRDAIEALASDVAGIEDPGGQLIAALDESLAEEPGGFTYEDDIEPWLGERVAVFVRSFEEASLEQEGTLPDGAILAEVTDTEAARDFVDRSVEANPVASGEERSYEGVEYVLAEDGVWGLVGDTLVFGTEDAFKVVVDAEDGESLADSDEYEQRTEPLEDGRLATLYVEPDAAVQAALSGGDLTPNEARLVEGLFSGPLSAPISLGLAANEDSVAIDGVASVDGIEVATASGMLEGLPAGASLAAAIPDAGGLLDRWLEALAHSGVPEAESIERTIAARTGLDPRRDVTSWLGDTAISYRGTEPSDFAAGVIAQTSDAEGPRALVDRLRELAEAESAIPPGGPPAAADYGFTVGLPVFGPRAEVGVFGDRFVASLGPTADELLEPDETLGEDDRFAAAQEELGDELSPVAYVFLQDAYELALLGADTEAEQAQYESWGPYVERLGSLIAGTAVDGDLLLSRLIITVAQ